MGILDMLGILLGELLAEAEALRVRIGLGFGEGQLFGDGTLDL